MKKLREFFPAVKADQRLDEAWQLLEQIKRDHRAAILQQRAPQYDRDSIRLADLELFRALRRTGEFRRAKALVQRWVDENWGSEKEQGDRIAALVQDAKVPYDEI